jgi:hypothetical protein
MDLRARRLAVALAGMLAALAAGSSHALTVSLTRPLSQITDTLLPALLPFSATHTATSGANSSTSTWNLTSQAFEVTFAHTRGATENAFAQTIMNLLFQVDAPAQYVLEGRYSALDPDGRQIQQVAILDDTRASGPPLFRGLQISEQTPDETLVLGQTQGDAGNVLIGSTTGMLLPGREYQILAAFLILNGPAPPGGPASASGYLRLSFVPEPSPALLWLVGPALLAASRRGRPRRA